MGSLLPFVKKNLGVVQYFTVFESTFHTISGLSVSEVQQYTFYFLLFTLKKIYPSLGERGILFTPKKIYPSLGDRGTVL